MQLAMKRTGKIRIGQKATIKGWTGRPKRGPKDYNAARTASAIADWAVDLMPNCACGLLGVLTHTDMKSKLKSADDVKHVIERSKGGRPAAILFTKSTVVTPLFKALTSDFHNELDPYAVKDSKSPAVFVGIVPTAAKEEAEETEDPFDVLAVHQDGHVRRLSPDLSTQRWSLQHSAIAKQLSSHTVDTCFLVEFE